LTMQESANIRKAFRYCEAIARRHYENFPVASLFLPRAKRPFVAAVYAFARAADDFADEGDLPPAERLGCLDDWEAKLDACYRGSASDPVFIALAETVRRHGIPQQLLRDLLTAFRMDVTTTRYRTYRELLQYCSCSANPIGRLVLYLFKEADERTLPLSDALCTALQLTNFWQDVAVDLRKGRVYLPLEDLDRFGYTEEDLFALKADTRFASLIHFQVERTRQLFDVGKPLAEIASKRLRFELRLTIAGGVAILDRIRRGNYDVLTLRPALTVPEKVFLLVKTAFHRHL
jgi:phytoene synthase